VDEEIESLKLQIYYYEELRLELERDLSEQQKEAKVIQSELQDKLLNQ
jgi:hypothetical protein